MNAALEFDDVSNVLASFCRTGSCGAGSAGGLPVVKRLSERDK
ncbi:hypothetical protein B0G80_7531 [Paraburkholderia sp. BL6669N2]|nr:hypothetical protein B0G80_7531 [Paraburkholderia sp. BL6669N2]